jgi:hypothetical protein
MPEGQSLQVTGPSPTDRKWYATVTRVLTASGIKFRVK